MADQDDVPDGIRQLVDTATEVVVTSPSVVGPLHWLTGDVDRARQLANDRLATALDQLGSTGASVVGGAQGDELLRSGFDEVMTDFRADHIVIVVPAHSQRIWRRQGVLEHFLDTFQVPVTVFPVRPA